MYVTIIQFCLCSEVAVWLSWQRRWSDQQS